MLAYWYIDLVFLPLIKSLNLKFSLNYCKNAKFKIVLYKLQVLYCMPIYQVYCDSAVVPK